jgi:hypothetical protein
VQQVPIFVTQHLQGVVGHRQAQGQTDEAETSIIRMQALQRVEQVTHTTSPIATQADAAAASYLPTYQPATSSSQQQQQPATTDAAANHEQKPA